MKKNRNYILLLVLTASVFFGACKKTEYHFGKIITPTNVAVTAAIQGAAANATGDGSGIVKFSIKADNALAYKIYFGNGDSLLTTNDTVTHKYTTLDTNLYTVTVNAIGTGGSISTISKQIKVLYSFQIPPDVIANLTNGSSKTWVLDKDTTGHFGVGQASLFYPNYYAADPNSRGTFACSYTSVITFAKAGANAISLNDNNMGSSFIIGAATAFYGQSGGDGCYVVNPGGTQVLGFSQANTGSNSSNSTGIQFSVPGNGLIDFGTGATSYEILSLTSTVLAVRDIGSDGNAWYQIFKAQ